MRGAGSPRVTGSDLHGVVAPPLQPPHREVGGGGGGVVDEGVGEGGPHLGEGCGLLYL